MNGTNYIALAIPVFFFLILVEVLADLIRGKKYYNLSDSINDLSCGISQQIFGVFTKTILLAGYIWIFDHYKFKIISDTSAVSWVALFIGVDFFYYWFHRLSHEINIIWWGHVPHHHSEEYNLSVALRQGTFQGSFSWLFYLLLALIGFSPVMFITVSSFNTLYQFWIHTRHIGRLGFLEWFLNTPSHHRVHHGKNPQYIDRNHGGMLIIWDRIFGTFEPENEPVVYGTVKPLNSFNPIWANFHYFIELFRISFKTRRYRDKIMIWFRKPGWLPQDMGGEKEIPVVNSGTYKKFTIPVLKSASAYCIIQFAMISLVTTGFIFVVDKLTTEGKILGAVFIWSGLYSIGNIIEKRRISLPVEICRMLIISIFLLLLYNKLSPVPFEILAGFIGFCIVSVPAAFLLIKKNAF